MVGCFVLVSLLLILATTYNLQPDVMELQEFLRKTIVKPQILFIQTQKDERLSFSLKHGDFYCPESCGCHNSDMTYAWWYFKEKDLVTYI